MPAAGRGPGGVVIQEWWGLVGHITAVADRFADAGFLALAPDLYHGKVAREPDEAGKLLMGMAMDQAARDIAGAARALAARAEVTGRIGTVGFCMGGSLALWSGYQGKVAVIHTDEHEGGAAAPGIAALRSAIEAAGGGRGVPLPRHRARVLQRRPAAGLPPAGRRAGLGAHA